MAGLEVAFTQINDLTRRIESHKLDNEKAHDKMSADIEELKKNDHKSQTRWALLIGGIVLLSSLLSQLLFKALGGH